MRWLTLAGRDLGDVRRARLLPTTVALFALLGGAVAGAYGHIYGMLGGSHSGTSLAAFLYPILLLLVPVIGALVASDAISSKREDGSIKVLFGLPYSRLDLVIGSFVGRTASLWVGLLAMAVIAGGIVYAQVDPGQLRPLLGLFAFTGLYAAVFAAIAVGLSAASASSTKATAASVGAVFVFVFRVWSVVPMGAAYVGNGFELPQEPPSWGLVWNDLNPSLAYQNAVSSVVPDLGAIPLVAPVEPGAPFHAQPEFAVGVLVGWILLALALGYVRLRRADL